MDRTAFQTAVDSTPRLTRSDVETLTNAIVQGRHAASRLATNQSHMPRRDHRLVREGQQAQDRWIEGNLRLVLAEAHKWRAAILNTPGLDLDDLIQEGNIGLIEATSRFDFERGTAFSTYAVPWIRRRIRETVESSARTVRLPENVQAELARVREAYEYLTGYLARMPTVEEVAEEAGLTVDRLEWLHARTRRPALMGDTLPEVADEDDEPSYEDPDIEELLETLEAEPRRVIVRRYGIGCEPTSQQALAAEMGCHPRTIRGIERRAMAAMRAAV